jgi:peptidoglycan hydrolase-like protein with peptidoglycan-binding domain
MAWIQVKTPNWNIAYEGGYCLRYVDDAFNAMSRKNNATASYNTEKANGNIRLEEPPRGVYTPVYFSLSNNSNGHVAIAFPDGRVASSTLIGIHNTPYIHASVADLVRVYSNGRTCKYLGWSTWVDGTNAVKWSDNKPAASTSGTEVLGRTSPATITRGDKVAALAAGMRRAFPSYTPAAALGPVFGPNLEKAVKEFQRRTGLTQDGFVGPVTKAKLAGFGVKF